MQNKTFSEKNSIGNEKIFKTAKTFLQFKKKIFIRRKKVFDLQRKDFKKLFFIRFGRKKF